jgi:hypothetical protein
MNFIAGLHHSRRHLQPIPTSPVSPSPHPLLYLLPHLLALLPDLFPSPNQQQIDVLIDDQSALPPCATPAASLVPLWKRSSTPTLHADSPWPPAPRPSNTVDQKPPEHRRRSTPVRLAWEHAGTLTPRWASSLCLNPDRRISNARVRQVHLNEPVQVHLARPDHFKSDDPHYESVRTGIVQSERDTCPLPIQTEIQIGNWIRNWLNLSNFISFDL